MTADNINSPWWSAARYADIRPFLQARHAVTRATRGFFDEQGFTEVETAVLQISPGNETHLHAPHTELTGPDGVRTRRYLRTSPEFSCKKLLAAGEKKIFEFARVFRDRERGRLTRRMRRFLDYPRLGSSGRDLPNITMRGKSSRRMPSSASCASDLRESRWYCRALLTPSAREDRKALRNVSDPGRPDGW